MGLRAVTIAMDQLLNACIGGMADETLSARAYRLAPVSYGWRFTRRVIDALFFFFDPDHCAASYFAEVARKHLPREYRK